MLNAPIPFMLTVIILIGSVGIIDWRLSVFSYFWSGFLIWLILRGEAVMWKMMLLWLPALLLSPIKDFVYKTRPTKF